MWIADKMLLLGELDYILTALVIVTITMLTSGLMSNTAVAASLLPIMAVLGAATELDPILLTAPVAFATRYGFMMPVGTLQTQLLLEVGMCQSNRWSDVDFHLILFAFQWSPE